MAGEALPQRIPLAIVSRLFPSGDRMAAIAPMRGSGIAAMEAMASGLACPAAPACPSIAPRGSARNPAECIRLRLKAAEARAPS